MNITRVLACVAVLVLAPFALAQPALSLPGGEVHGSVLALIRGEEFFPLKNAFVDRNIFLPDINVFLKNTATSALTPEVATNLDGSFTFPSQPQATYQLCWKSDGFQPGCGTPFVLRSFNVYLKPVAAFAMEGAIYGRVTLKDGLACRFLNPMMAKDTWTTVTAASGSETRTVRANSYGEYVLPQRPPGKTEVTARCEGVKTSASINFGGVVQQVDLTLPNALPHVAIVSASQAGAMARAAAGGSTVQVHATAQDGGGFPLHYKWAVDPPEPSFVSADSPDVTWKLPGSGLATIYVLAFDDMGGNQLNRVALSTTPDKIPFSGIVTANDAPFVPNAEVTVNARSLTAAPPANSASCCRRTPRDLW
ncbi:MAG: carboxypeptidase regulatory-like domain-containing protein [Candidatus Eremiobacteraeota bacterium]|nr:carboxypeptidase regulatory-like domain-containing protein [Candidatus Eremiobacteraeota bacterium]